MHTVTASGSGFEQPEAILIEAERSALGWGTDLAASSTAQAHNDTMANQMNQASATTKATCEQAISDVFGTVKVKVPKRRTMVVSVDLIERARYMARLDHATGTFQTNEPLKNALSNAMVEEAGGAGPKIEGSGLDALGFLAIITITEDVKVDAYYCS